MTRHLIRGQFTNTRDKRCDDICPFCKRECMHPANHVYYNGLTPMAHQCSIHWWARIIIPNNQLAVIGATYGIQEKNIFTKGPVLNPRQRGAAK